MSVIVDEFYVKLGFNPETTKLREFMKQLEELNLDAVISATGLGGIVAALDDIIHKADAAGTALNQLSSITGVSQQTFQAWEKAAQESGVPLGAVSSQIQQIQQDIIQMEKFGTGPALMWQKAFGVNAFGRSGDPQGVFRDILKSMQGMTTQQKLFWIQGTDIGQQMLSMVNNIDLVNLGLSNADGTFKDISQLHKDITKLTLQWQQMIMAVGGALEPILRPFIDGVTQIAIWVQQGEESLNGWEKSLVNVAGVFLVILGIVNMIKSALVLAAGAGLLSPAVMGALGFVATKINPWIAGGALAIAGVGFLKEQFDLHNPESNNISSSDNSKDIDITHNYNINGGNPSDVYRAVRQANAYVDPQAADSREPNSSY